MRLDSKGLSAAMEAVQSHTNVTDRGVHPKTVEAAITAYLASAAAPPMAILYEVITNGRWTEGEQLGEWAIPKEVYEMVAEAHGKASAAATAWRPPEGWKLVPMEPTREMLAHVKVSVYAAPVGIKLSAIYKEMLSAAPPPPEEL